MLQLVDISISKDLIEEELEVQVQAQVEEEEYTKEEENRESILIIIVINYNYYIERAYAKRVETTWAKKRDVLSLIRPLEKAPYKEYSAYVAILQQNKPTITQILKQPIKEDIDFFYNAIIPYIISFSILNKVYTISSSTS